MTQIVNKLNAPEVGTPSGKINMSVYKSIENKLATVVAHRVASKAGNRSEMTVDFLVDKLRVAKDELVAFLAERKNLNIVRGMVSKRMYGVKIRFEGDIIEVKAAK
jgi:hypothetical protein|tara:strand:+ start:1135 stop:1452 length:318 start_codon:yes stop_codon:yes gene_type:complete